jgi:hypothetical protein
MSKKLRPEHYGRNPRHRDWERQGWPAQVQTLAQRVLPRASRLFGIANDLSWTTSEVVRSGARVGDDYEPVPRTPAEIKANYRKQVERIKEELERQRIPYEVVDPSHFHTLSKRFKRQRKMFEWGKRQYEPFYLAFSEYLGTELPGHDTSPYEENRHTVIRDHFGRQLDLHYIDKDGDVYFGEINGPWKMKMEFANEGETGRYYRLDLGDGVLFRGWTPMGRGATVQPWQDINDSAFAEGHGSMIWRPVGPAIIFPKGGNWTPTTLNYP